MIVGEAGINKGKQFDFWRDTHLRISGDAVLELLKRFTLDWEYAAKESIDEKQYVVAKLMPSNDEIYVLSAKYGLIDLDKIIEPYDTKLETLSEEEYFDWQYQVFTQYLMKIYNKLMSDEEVEIYLFKSDSDYLKKFRQITTIEYDIEWRKNNKIYLGHSLNVRTEASKLSKKEPWEDIYGKK